MEHQSEIPPPQPPDPLGTHPATNWQQVVEKVQWIQQKLAGERAAKNTVKEKEAQSK
jgi:hypothetical protein